MNVLSGCDCKAGTWEAWFDSMPPGESRLMVRGICTCPTTGFKGSLQRANPQGINPEILILDLEMIRPGGEAGQMVTDVPVEYSEQGFRYTDVTIRPCNITITVRDAS